MNRDHVCPPGRSSRRYMAIVIDSDNCDVLAKRSESKISFPRVDCPEIPHRGRHMSECFSRALEQLTQIQFELVFLYCNLNETYHRHLEGIPIAIFECLAPVDPTTKCLVKPIPNEYEWLNIGSIEDIVRSNLGAGRKTWEVDIDIFGWNAATRGDYGGFSEEGLRPWELPGWFHKTTEDAKAVLSELGYTVNGPFEQHQISPTAAVLRADTSKGRVYLKASNRREGKTMQCVAGFAPYLVCQPLNVNVGAEWMLMNDYGPTLSGRFSRSDFETIQLLHGKLQLEAVQHVEDLIKVGVPRESADSIIIRAKRMLEDPSIRESFGKCKGFENLDESGELVWKGFGQAMSDFMKHIYDAQGVPPTLVHGDLYDDNIIKPDENENKYTVYDWGCARIDLPFSDLAYLITGVTPREERREDSIDPYLKLWEEYGSISRLRELCSWVSVKDDLLRLLERYEYAKGKRLSPRLEDKNMNFLHGTLMKMQKAMSELKG